MTLEQMLIVGLIAITMLVLVFHFIRSKTTKNVNEWSYKRYADFYGKMELEDPLFDKKIKKILKLINEDKCDDIEFIAKDSGCTVEECCLKINYLKNKRMLDNCYIDKITLKIIQCSEEDIELVEKYSPFIYGRHASLEEIVSFIPMQGSNEKKRRKQVIRDLKYLISNNIVNGVIFNEVDEKLIYYHVEKHKKEKDYITVSCSKCGALNDVDCGNKVRCRYCNAIVESYLTFEDIKNK